jgi:hypothetical protein
MTTILLNTARQTLGAFARGAANTLSALHGLDDDQTRGLRNLVSKALRNGGKRTKGYYKILPTGKGDTVQVPEAIMETACDTARETLNVLITAIAAAGSRRVTYSTGAKGAKGKPGDADYQPAIKGRNVAFDIDDTTEWEPLDDETMDALMDAAANGGATDADLADLDF